ncbi:peptidylprolyl isomerase [Streptomyces hundungensis]|uniref:peptidylprolyl isomerase n=1 Tax=Streptomyces hundungensis TaxID=1077946 RepID=UPI0031EE72FE
MLRRKGVLLAAVVLFPLATATQAGAAAPSPQPSAPAPHASPAPAATACAYTPAVPADNYKGIPDFDPVKAARPFSATLRTSQGVITFKALTDNAPCTTNSFRFLAEKRYFNGSHCHRLTTARLYVLQCGDPTGTGSGGPGYSFPDENLTGATYPAGTVAMANAGPNTNGSQFFFVWKDTKLSPAYTPFGRVTAGLDVLKKIAAGGEDDQNGPGDGYPTLPVNINRVTIKKG